MCKTFSKILARSVDINRSLAKYYNCGRPWPAAYINIIQNTHQIQVLTEALFRAQAIF